MTTIASPIFPSPMAGTCTRRRRLDGRADDRDRALSGAIILGFIWLIRDGPSAGSSRLRTRRWPSSTAASPRAPSPSTTTTSAETSSRVWQRGALIQAQLAAIEGPSGDEDAPLLIGAAVRRRGLRASPPPTARAAGMRLLRSLRWALLSLGSERHGDGDTGRATRSELRCLIRQQPDYTLW
jgi:hypothetical protein